MENKLNNPYAAPKVDAANINSSGPVITSNGDILMVPIGTQLPDICLITGEMKNGKYFDKKLVWVAPWIYIFILFNILILIIVYLIFRKKARLKYYLSSKIVQKRKARITTLWILFAVALIALMAGIKTGYPGLIILPLLVILTIAVLSLIIVQNIKVNKIDKQYIYLKKVHRDAVEYILSQQNGS